MSAHLLPVTVAWLARLPDNTPLIDLDTGERVILVQAYQWREACSLSPSQRGSKRIEDGRYALDMWATVTAAIVAAQIVRPMGRQDPDTVQAVLAAVCMEAAPRQVEIITRLARAAMEAA